MSTSTKALIILVAVAAFAIGALVNMARVADQIDSEALLSAKLSGSDASQNSVSAYLDKLTLINFWASWCAPCREEMPLFESMVSSHKTLGFQVIGVAIDSPDRAQSMLDSMGISYPILYAEHSGMALMESVGNPQGYLPYSLLLDQNGKVLEQRLGPIHEQDIATWIETHL